MLTALEGLVLPKVYQGHRPEKFPCPYSFDWFKRKYKKELAEAGALVIIGGRVWLDPAKTDAVVLAVGGATARKIAA